MHHNGRDWIGFIEVTDDIEHDEGLGDWVTFAWNFVATLPPKIEKPAAKKAAAPKQAARTRRTARPD